jgi:hypothetical protein
VKRIDGKKIPNPLEILLDQLANNT